MNQTDDRTFEPAIACPDMSPDACAALWKQALENLGDGLWEWRIGAGRLIFSSRWSERLGQVDAEVGATVADFERLVHPDDLEDRRRKLRAYLAGTAETYKNLQRIRTRKDGYRWFLERATIIARDDEGNPARLVGIISEIDPPEPRATATAAGEADSRAVLDSVVDGIILIDTQGIIQSLNPAALSMFGYRAEELVGRTINTLMPEPFRSKHDGYIQRHLETGETHIIGYPREVSGRRKDGTTFPMSLAVSRLELAGRSCFTGIVRDVTKSRRSETTQQMLSALYGTQAILISDADNHIIMINRPFTEMTGYELHEVIGRNPRLLSSGRQPPEFYQAMWLTLAATGHWQGQLWNRRKNGEEYLESLAISLIYDDNGEVFRHVAVFSEITP